MNKVPASYTRINSYTRILNDGKKTLQEQQDLINKQSLSKSENYLKDKKNRRPVDQNKLYRKFVDEVFAKRKFIGQKEFYKLITKKFNANTTWYRDRMIQLGYIKVHNRLIRAVKTETEETNIEN